MQAEASSNYIDAPSRNWHAPLAHDLWV